MLVRSSFNIRIKNGILKKIRVSRRPAPFNYGFIIYLNFKSPSAQSIFANTISVVSKKYAFAMIEQPPFTELFVKKSRGLLQLTSRYEILLFFLQNTGAKGRVPWEQGNLFQLYYMYILVRFHFWIFRLCVTYKFAWKSRPVKCCTNTRDQGCRTKKFLDVLI